MHCSFCLATQVVCKDCVSLPDLHVLKEGHEASGEKQGPGVSCGPQITSQAWSKNLPKNLLQKTDFLLTSIPSRGANVERLSPSPPANLSGQTKLRIPREKIQLVCCNIRLLILPVLFLSLLTKVQYNISRTPQFHRGKRRDANNSDNTCLHFCNFLGILNATTFEP